MSMADRDGFIWYDGKLVPWRDATTHVLTHTLHYGMGVFEGVRAYKTVDGSRDLPLAGPYRPTVPLGAHLRDEDPVHQGGARRSAARMRARQQARRRATCGRSPSTARKQMGVAARHEPGARRDRRVAVGRVPRGRRPGEGHTRQDVVVHAPPRQHHDVRRQGLRAITPIRSSPTRKRRRTATTRRCCSIRRATSPKARARTSSSSATASSTTPDLSSGALNGITRDTIITFARELGIPIVERRITRDEVYSADEAFFTGTAAEVTPIRELDNRQIGAGHRGPITAKLQHSFSTRSTAGIREKRVADPRLTELGRKMTETTRQATPAIEIGDKDLPLYCPNPAMPLWSSHPRVFLDVADTGRGDVPVLRHALSVEGGPLKKGH